MSLWSRVAYAVRCSPLARSRCRQAAGMLQKQLDGTLDPIATTLLRAHLAGCRQCGLEAEVYTPQGVTEPATPRPRGIGPTPRHVRPSPRRGGRQLSRQLTGAPTRIS